MSFFLKVKFSKYLNRRVFVMKDLHCIRLMDAQLQANQTIRWAQIHKVQFLTLRSICDW